MPNFEPSTREMLAYINYGLRVDKGPVLATAWGVQVAYPLFNLVGGRALILQLIGEITTVLSNNATLVKYYFTPTGGAQIDLSAISLTIAQLAVAERIWFVGGAVATAAVITATPGISDINVTPHVVGSVTSAGANCVCRERGGAVAEVQHHLACSVLRAPAHGLKPVAQEIIVLSSPQKLAESLPRATAPSLRGGGALNSE